MTNQAVVVVDMQNAILDIPGMRRPTETAAALNAVVARISALVQRARSQEVPVIFAQHDGQSVTALNEDLKAGRFGRKSLPVRLT